MEDAGRKAILESGLKKRDISLVIAVSTTSPPLYNLSRSNSCRTPDVKNVPRLK